MPMPQVSDSPDGGACKEAASHERGYEHDERSSGSERPAVQASCGGVETQAPNCLHQDQGAFVTVPRCVIQEVLADGCCPLQLRLQLQQALAGDFSEVAREAAYPANEAAAASAAVACAGSVASFLELDDLLSSRATGTDFLCAIMQRQPEDDCSWHISEPPTPPARAYGGKDVATDVRDKLRVRLWLQRIGDVAAGTADERIFETTMKSFWDDALRRRLEDEVAAAKRGMEDEVRAAKENMLQCVQAISEEVDRRVANKVAALQKEFDQRAAEQARGLQEMVERRVCEQTAALQAEVDRRTESVRAAVEQRAREQEEAAIRLQEQVARMRSSLEERVREQEEVATRLGAELASLRGHLAELTVVRDKLEARILESERNEAALQRLVNRGAWCIPCLELWRRERRPAS